MKRRLEKIGRIQFPALPFRIVRGISVGILLAVLTSPLAADERKTVYVDKMEGLEPFVEKALQASELPFDFIEETKQPEMKATLARKHSAYAEIVYKHKLGRNETHRLELRDIAQDKVIAWHDFQLNNDDASRQRATRDFAEKVKKAYAKMKR